MRTRTHGRRLRARIGTALTPLQATVCALALALADWGSRHTGDSFFPGAPLDETAHLLTALLLLQAFPARLRAKVAGPALLASVAIDLDHVPQYLGYDFMSVGTPRPYSHSLLSPLLLLGLALAMPRHRRVCVALAIGLVLHFFRDLGEGNGSGVPLLWPLSSHGYSYPHAAYLAMMAAVSVAAIMSGALRQRSWARLPRRARRRSASRASA